MHDNIIRNLLTFCVGVSRLMGLIRGHQTLSMIAGHHIAPYSNNDKEGLEVQSHEWKLPRNELLWSTRVDSG